MLSDNDRLVLPRQAGVLGEARLRQARARRADPTVGMRRWASVFLVKRLPRPCHTERCAAQRILAASRRSASHSERNSAIEEHGERLVGLVTCERAE